jgi:hypothetical protein
MPHAPAQAASPSASTGKRRLQDVLIPSIFIVIVIVFRKLQDCRTKDIHMSH